MAEGKAAYLKNLRGDNNSPIEGIHAKCYECMGQYKDGKIDCKVVKCPLYPWMPYSKVVKRKKKAKSLQPAQMKLPFL